MKARRTYSSTRFNLLNPIETDSNVKKKLIWSGIVIGTIILCIPSACIYYKTFFTKSNSKSNEVMSKSILNKWCAGNSSHILNSIIHMNSVNYEKFINANKYSLDFVCGEEYPLLIPKNKTSEYFLQTNLDNFIEFNLIFYYQEIAAKYDSNFLKLIFEKWHKKLFAVSKSEDIKNFLESLGSTKFKFCLSVIKEEKHLFKLKNFEYLFSLTAELYHWYSYLENMRTYLSNYEQQLDRKKYVNIETSDSFYEFIQKTQQRLYHTPHKFEFTEKKLIELNKIIDEWAKPTKMLIEGSLVTFYNKVIILSEINEIIKTLNMTAIENIKIIASYTIYLNEDLFFPGINVAIIAPRWTFLRKIKIILSGKSGKEYDDVVEGQPGKPGNPGTNSGDFLGAGDINEKFLTVLCNGGSGGRGQNGARGLNGINFTRPEPPVNKPTCLFKIGSFKNSFGQTITHYKVFSKIGCGGSGKAGGVGGIGGKGGKIILINRSKLTIKNGMNGMRGPPGKGGEGGTGGQNGCFYEVMDIDDEVLHLITAVKCQINILPFGKPGRDNHNSMGLLHPSPKTNLSVSNFLVKSFSFLSEDFVNFNDSVATSFLKQLSSFNSSNCNFIINQYKVFQKFEKVEFYEILENTIIQSLETANSETRPVLLYLKTLIMGKLLILKKKNFMFIDFDQHLDTLEDNIKLLSKNIAEYPISSLNKKILIKLNKIKDNFNFLKSKLKFIHTENGECLVRYHHDFNEKCENVTLILQERNVLNVTLIYVDLTICLVNLIQNQLINDKSESELKNCFAKNFASLNSVKHSEVFSKFNNDLISKLYEKELEDKLNSSFFNKYCAFVQNLTKSTSCNTSFKWKQIVIEIMGAMDFFLKSDVLSTNTRILLKTFVDELDNFNSLYSTLQWLNLEQLFRKSLTNLKSFELEGEFEELKYELRDIMITLQYVSAVDIVELKLNLLKTLPRHLPSTSNIVEEAFLKINHLRIIGRQTPVCQDIHEAVFDRNSTNGEFYFWPNSEIRSDLINLFKGEKINLKADLNNHHVLDKNFLKFKTLKFKFSCDTNKNSILNKILENFRIKITHWGYSYYNWKGKTVVVVSEEVTFDYGLKTFDNGEPEVYNVLLKKFQEEEIMMSPFTTWTIKLLPFKDSADYNKLSEFVDCVSLSLIGKGIFIS